MKRLLVTLAVAFVAVSASAAIQYEFVQKNTSGDAVEPLSDLTARAVIDGERSRIDFVGGTLYPPGTYVVDVNQTQREVTTRSTLPAPVTTSSRSTNDRRLCSARDTITRPAVGIIAAAPPPPGSFTFGRSAGPIRETFVRPAPSTWAAPRKTVSRPPRMQRS